VTLKKSFKLNKIFRFNFFIAFQDIWIFITFQDIWTLRSINPSTSIHLEKYLIKKLTLKREIVLNSFDV